MRVNPNTTPDLLAALQASQKEEQTAMIELASGRRVNLPSDDPAATALVIQNHARSAQADQYLRSMDSVRGQLLTADTTLNSVVLALDRSITLGVQGANGTQSDSNRAALIDELKGLKDQLLSLANLAFQGRYVFSGTESTTKPFVLDDTQPSGVRYDGNDGSNKVTLGEGVDLQVNLAGSAIFTTPGKDVFQSVNDLINALTANSGVDAAVTSVRAALDQVTSQRVFYGNALNQMESQGVYLRSEKLQLSQQENGVAGADMAATVSRLVNAQNARNATLAAVGKTSQLSLFDYLK
jgi:flagellar hook-associated protein 3 FlgL